MGTCVRRPISLIVALSLAACGESQSSKDTSRGPGDGGGGPPKPASFVLMEPIPEFRDRAATVADPFILSIPRFVNDDGTVAFGSMRVGSMTDQGILNWMTTFQWTASRSDSVATSPILNFESFISNREPNVDAVTPDYSAVVGRIDASNLGRSFLWTEAEGSTFVSPEGDGYCTASFVSDDAAVVVGSCLLPGAPTFRWTRASGPVLLPPLPGDTSSSPCYLSADGSVVAGNSFGPTSALFRWTEETGTTEIEGLPGYDYCAFSESRGRGPYAIGACARADGTGQPFFWRDGGELVGLGDLSGYQQFTPSLVTNDGSVVVGSGFLGSDLATQSRVFRWSPASGTTEWAPFAGFGAGSFVMSDDGSVVAWSDMAAGTGTSTSTSHRWATGAVSTLQPLPTHTVTEITGMSGDGSIVSGASAPLDESGNRGTAVPVVWTSDGVVRVDTLLAESSLLPPDLTILTASVGRDKRLLFGTADDGAYVLGWVAWLPP